MTRVNLLPSQARIIRELIDENRVLRERLETLEACDHHTLSGCL